MPPKPRPAVSLPILEASQPSACECPGSLSDKFLQPCLLLLLRRQPSYGYSLLEELQALRGSYDPSVVYRTLRRMEEEKLVRSQWDTSGSGPARRIYRLTPEGEEYLHLWAVTIEENKRTLESFLDEYRRAPARAKR
ncbi:MAG: helix-turn-helix transcriptional regulator [Nitrospinota bacterium]